MQFIINPFTGKFDAIGCSSPTPPVEEYITFADPVVEAICVANWGSNGKLSYTQAAAVITLGNKFSYATENPPAEPITSFEELQYFINLKDLNADIDGYGAFEGAEQLTSIIIPDSVTSIGDYAFSGCSSLTSIIIPNSVTSIGDGALESCSSLTSIIIPDSVTSIHPDVIANCSSLTSIIIPDSVTSIGGGAFAFSGLTSIIIPDSVTSIGDGAFNSCIELNSVNIPNSVISIDRAAFIDCSGLTSIIIPNSITSIAPKVFQSSGLTSINIPDTITLIGESALRFCSSLTSIIIGNNIDLIDSYAISACESLKDITITTEIPPTLGSNAFQDNILLENIFVPAQSVEAYKIAAQWINYSSIISAIV